VLPGSGAEGSSADFGGTDGWHHHEDRRSGQPCARWSHLSVHLLAPNREVPPGAFKVIDASPIDRGSANGSGDTQHTIPISSGAASPGARWWISIQCETLTAALTSVPSLLGLRGAS
jgi:hypothetical protein